METLSDTICAISTPFATGGIGVIRVSGEKAIQICNKILKLKDKKFDMLKTHTVHFGKVIDQNGTILDEVLITIMKAPNSFTGEDVVEISCHGGLLILQSVLSLLIENGARRAEAGEFSKRAFLNGKMDLSAAEGIIDLINAKTKLSHKAALYQLEGAVFKKIEEIRAGLLDINVDILAYIDFPDEGLVDVDTNDIAHRLSDVIKKLENLKESFHTGKIIKEGIDVAIVGKPNTGKSTLMNLLLGTQKSIVTDIAGTTRDLVEDSVVFGDILLRLTDTAGIRKTKDTVEEIGVSRALSQIEKSQLIFAVFDGSEELTEQDFELIDKLNDKQVIAIINKADKAEKINKEYINSEFKQIVYISALKDEGIDTLYNVVKELFLKEKLFFENGEIITSLRHQESIIKALNNVIHAKETILSGFTPDVASVDIVNSIEALGEITGKTVNEEIIDNIFSKFCVGK